MTKWPFKSSWVSIIISVNIHHFGSETDVHFTIIIFIFFCRQTENDSFTRPCAVSGEFPIICRLIE